MTARPTAQLTLAFLITAISILPLRAADEKEAAKPDAEDTKGYQLQRLDEPALPADPVKLRTDADQKRVEAHSWYMTGWLFKQREKYREAMAAFEKATDADPNFSEAYSALIEVALHLRENEKAISYAVKAVQVDPENFQLLRQLGVEMVKARRLADAIKYLELALNSTELDHTSRFYVLINRDLGIIYNGIGEAEKAGACYEVVLDALLNPAKYGLDPRTTDELQKHASTSFERIGQVLLAANKTDLALKALERAVKDQNGKPGGVNLLLAQVYNRTEDYAKALEQLDLFFKSGQQKGRAPFVLLAALLEKLEKTDTLVERLEALVKKDPRNQDLRFFVAATYVTVGRIDEAEQIYREALDDKATSEAYLGLASIYRQRGKAKELLDSLSHVLSRQQDLQAVAAQFAAEMKAIEKDEKLLKALLEAGREATSDGVGPNDFAKVLFLAQLAAGVKNVDAAVEFYEMALEAAPSRAEAVFRGHGEVLMDADRYDEAADLYQKAIENPLLQGSKPDYYLRKALALEMGGNTTEALEAIGEANKLVPQGHPFLAFREAWIYYHSHQYEKAVEHYEAFLQKYPDATFAKQAKFSLSAIYVQLGEVTKGEQILERYLEENSDDPGVNNDLGYLYADQGKNLKKAKSMIQKAIKAEPENAAYMDSMGWVLFKLGELKEAKGFLIKASTLERGEDATIWDHLGDCQLKLKEPDDAKKSWTKALELLKAESNPDKDLLKQLHEKLGIKEDAEPKADSTDK
jgi:tetratricopeptide (TPR) repeat protein